MGEQVTGPENALQEVMAGAATGAVVVVVVGMVMARTEAAAPGGDGYNSCPPTKQAMNGREPQLATVAISCLGLSQSRSNSSGRE